MKVEHEVLVVVEADAAQYPRAVVVHLEHACVAELAVGSAQRGQNTALVAEE
jgi:hypothetical protein